MATLSISNLSSLNFSHDWKAFFQQSACYTQKFLTTDVIRIQFAVSKESPGFFDVILVQDSVSRRIIPRDIIEDEDTIVYDISFNNMEQGCYSLQFVNLVNGKVITESRFAVREYWDENTVHIRYVHRRNEYDFVADGEFHFRVEGVFLPSEVDFLAESDVFRDQRYGLHQLSAFPYETNVLTVGGGQGVPNWVGRKLNMIFSLSSVFVDGQAYVRSEGSSPEKTILHQNLPLFVYKILLEPDNTWTLDYTSTPLRVVSVDRLAVRDRNRLQAFAFNDN